MPVSTKQNRNRAVLLHMILERLPPETRRRQARRRAGDEGGHRRPPQRGQEHVRQHAGPGRADDRQRNPRHDARQRRRAVRARRQGVRRHRHAGHAPHQEPRRDDRLLRRPPRPAQHPPGRRGAAVLRRHAADQQGRQAAVRVHRRRVQAVHLRREQVGPAGQDDAHREVGALPATTRSARCGTCRSRSSPGRRART